MTTIDFAPLWRSTVGFDHLADFVDNLRQTVDDNYPPYNIERCGEDRYRISLAMAGFAPEDVTVTAEQNTLTIEGTKKGKDERDYLFRGIAARPFRRVFNLADYVKVNNATFADGLLNIELAREIPAAMKPRRIPIEGVSASPQLVQPNAA
jgi:molecular chaperone IbpA